MTQEALAQTQEPDYWLGYGLQAHTEKPFEGATPLYTHPPQRTEQEPVAMWDGKYQIEFGNLSAYKHGEHSWIPLYTTSPQRTWVGLTAEEKKNIFLKWYGKLYTYTKQVQAVMDSVEAKLKEKNT